MYSYLIIEIITNFHGLKAISETIQAIWFEPVQSVETILIHEQYSLMIYLNI